MLVVGFKPRTSCHSMLDFPQASHHPNQSDSVDVLFKKKLQNISRVNEKIQLILYISG